MYTHLHEPTETYRELIRGYPGSGLNDDVVVPPHLPTFAPPAIPPELLTSATATSYNTQAELAPNPNGRPKLPGPDNRSYSPSTGYRGHFSSQNSEPPPPGSHKIPAPGGHSGFSMAAYRTRVAAEPRSFCNKHTSDPGYHRGYGAMSCAKSLQICKENCCQDVDPGDLLNLRIPRVHRSSFSKTSLERHERLGGGFQAPKGFDASAEMATVDKRRGRRKIPNRTNRCQYGQR